MIVFLQSVGEAKTTQAIHMPRYADEYSVFIDWENVRVFEEEEATHNRSFIVNYVLGGAPFVALKYSVRAAVIKLVMSKGDDKTVFVFAKGYLLS